MRFRVRTGLHLRLFFGRITQMWVQYGAGFRETAQVELQSMNACAMYKRTGSLAMRAPRPNLKCHTMIRSPNGANAADK